MMVEPKCYHRECIHFHWPPKIINSELEDDCTLTCDAFPEGIPAPILWGSNNHVKPFSGDHGIRFERAPRGRHA